MGGDALTAGGDDSHSPPTCHVPGFMFRCRYCGRECEPWPLARPNGCSPPDWTLCIRQEDDCEFIPRP